MKGVFKTLLCVIAICAVTLVARAEEDKKPAKEETKTLKGTLGCPKCVFKLEGFKACGNAIKVEEGGKDVYYVLSDKGGKESYHKAICTGEAKGSVTGTVLKTKKNGVTEFKPAKDGVKYAD